MGGSPGEIKHKLVDALSQYSRMDTLLAVMCDNTCRVLPTREAQLSFGVRVFFGSQSHSHESPA